MAEIGEDDREDDEHAGSYEAQARVVGCGAPDGGVTGHDIGPKAHRQPGEAKQKNENTQPKHPVFVPTPEIAPNQNEDARGRERQHRERDELRPGEPAFRHIGRGDRGPGADQQHGSCGEQNRRMPDLTAEDLRAAHRPPDEPAGAKEPITAEEPDAARQAEDRKPGERAPREDAVPDRHAANETAEDEALRQHRQHGAAREGIVPRPTETTGLEAKLKSDAAEDQRKQHRHDWQIEGRQQDVIGDRKDGPEQGAAEDQPGLVAIPRRGDALHHNVPVPVARGEDEEDTDAEIEAVGQDIERDGERRDERENERQVHRHPPVAKMDRVARPTSAGPACASPGRTAFGCGSMAASGPRIATRAPYQKKASKSTVYTMTNMISEKSTEPAATGEAAAAVRRWP